MLHDKYFTSFSYFWAYLFDKPLDELNNTKIYETSKIVVNTARGYCPITSLTLAWKKIQGM